jgi:hypothetical protein
MGEAAAKCGVGRRRQEDERGESEAENLFLKKVFL